MGYAYFLFILQRYGYHVRVEINFPFFHQPLRVRIVLFYSV